MNTESAPPSSPEPRDVMNIEEAADFLRVSTSHLYKLSAAGKVPCAKVGGRSVFRRAALLAYLEELEKR